MGSKSSTRTANGYLVANGTAIVSLGAMPDTATLDVGRMKSFPIKDGDAVEIMAWGSKNDLPFIREELVIGNNIVPALIERKRNILCGQDWFAYTEKFEAGSDGKVRKVLDEVPMSEEAAAFFKKFRKVGRQLVGEMLKHGMAIPEFLRNKGNKIISVKSIEVKYVRAEKKNDMGEVPAWWYSNTWQAKNQVKQQDKVMRKLPVHDPEKKQPRFIVPLIDDLFNDGYYPIPAYWGGRHWITLSNIIPLFHEANLKHGASPRFHIILPYDYFYDYEKMNSATDEAERAKLIKEFKGAERAFVDDLNNVLTSIGNTGRTIVTKSEMVEVLGGRYDKRIQIEEIKFDMRDEALLKLYAASNVANVSAQALHPTLASIETAGKGIGSGTEIRNAFLLYLIIAAPVYREALYECIELVKADNGWPAGVKYAIRDAEMTTLAENPAGVQNAETPIAT